MRRAILGVLVGVGLVALTAGLLGLRSEVLAQRVSSPPATASGELIAVPSSLGEKGQLLTIIDPRQQTIGVYFIDGPSGEIVLRSVRNIRWDLQMAEFNTAKPAPREIRVQLEQR